MAGLPNVAGVCPACNLSVLFLGIGGHITCSNDECPDPGCVDKLLHDPSGIAEIGELAEVVAGVRGALTKLDAGEQGAKKTLTAIRERVGFDGETPDGDTAQLRVA